MPSDVNTNAASDAAEDFVELDIKLASVYITKLIETLSIKGVKFDKNKFHGDTIGFLLKIMLGIGSNRLSTLHVFPLIEEHNLKEGERDWGRLIDLYFPPNGRPRKKLFAVLYDAGFTLKELIELEYLRGEEIWRSALALPDVDEKDRKIIAKFLKGEKIIIEEKKTVTKWFGLVKSEVIEKQEINIRGIPEYVVIYLKGWLKLKLEEEKIKVSKTGEVHRALSI